MLLVLLLPTAYALTASTFTPTTLTPGREVVKIGLINSTHHNQHNQNYEAHLNNNNNNNNNNKQQAFALTLMAASSASTNTQFNSMVASGGGEVELPPTIPIMNPISTSEFLLVIVLISLILVSIVGNCLVCVAIFTDRRLRKLGNAFIVSLAIADLFVSCLVMTFALCNDLMNYWIFGDWFCDVWISFDIMCCTASILNLCAISLDRFIHIKDCLLYNQWMTRRVAISAVIIIWFISALVSFVPINLGWHKPDHQFGSGSSSSGRSSSTQHNGNKLHNAAAAQTHNIEPVSWSALDTTNKLLDEVEGEGASTFAPFSHNNVASPSPSPSPMDKADFRNAHKLDYLANSAAATPANSLMSSSASKAIENQSSQQQQQQEQQKQELLDTGIREGRRKLFRRMKTNSEIRSAASAAEEDLRVEEAEDGDGNMPKRRQEEEEEEDFVSSSSPSPLLVAANSGGLLLPLATTNAAGSSSGWMVGGRQEDEEQAEKKRLTAPGDGEGVVQFNQVESNPQDGSQIGKLNPTSGQWPHHFTQQQQQQQHPEGNRLTQFNWPSPSSSSSAAAAALYPISDTSAQQQLAYHQPAIERAPPEAPGGQKHQERQRQQQHEQATSAHHAQCMLTLTPTYAIISSTISFYIPCIIMLGLYTKLFACARKHVRNIQAISKAPAPIAITRSNEPIQQQQQQQVAATTFCTQATTQQPSDESPHSAAHEGPLPLRTWLKLGPKPITTSRNKHKHSKSNPNAPNAQTQNDKSIKAQHDRQEGEEDGTHNNNSNNNNNKPYCSSGSGSSVRTLVSSRKSLLKRDHSNSNTKLNNTGDNLTTTQLAGELNNNGVSGDTIILRNHQQQQQCHSVDQLPANDNPNMRQKSFMRKQQKRQMDHNDEEDDDVSEETVTLSTNDKPCGVATNHYIMTANREEEGGGEKEEQLKKSNFPQQSSTKPPQQQQQQQQQLQHDRERAAPEERRPFLDHTSGSIRLVIGRTKNCLNPQGSKVNFQGPNQQQSGQLATHKAAVTLGIIMGTFLFCWVPFFCLNIIKAFCVDCIPSSVFRAFTWLGYANSALNPIIYGIHNSEFRCAFNRIFFKHLNIKNSRYYLNRRFSYDQHHPNANRQQQNCHARAANLHKTLKSDAVT